MKLKIDPGVREGVDLVTLYERQRIVWRLYVPAGTGFLAVAEQLKLYRQPVPGVDDRQLELPHTSAADESEAAQ
jgi:hypothetical protein